jgi:hypothetical protein
MRSTSSTLQTAPSILPIRADRRRRWRDTAGASLLSASSARRRQDIKPRNVMILVEWKSKAAFDDYCTDPKIADLHPHREKGAGDYIWHLFDKLEDLRPILK